jgi:hypothetical protein
MNVTLTFNNAFNVEENILFVRQPSGLNMFTCMKIRRAAPEDAFLSAKGF